jgi:hypothetical protein
MEAAIFLVIENSQTGDTQMVTDADLVKFCGEALAIRKAFYDKHFPGQNAGEITFEKGRRNARIVISGRAQRSVYCFIDLTNGNILKAAGWKAPAPNGVRGNIANGAASCCGWNGCEYLR